MTMTPADAFTAFAVGREPGAPKIEMTQALGPRLTDHRGLIDLPAITVLFDDLGGYPFYVTDRSSSSMQARLTMSMLHRPAVTERLTATAELRLQNPGYGTTTVDISGDDGRTLCVGLARNVRVGRALVVDGDGTLELASPVTPDDAAVPAAPDASLSGREVIDAIRAGDAPIGPLSELLGGSVTAVDDDGLTFTCITAPWMGNVMGTMHGGVIGAIVGQACSFGAQAAMLPGREYQIVDFTVAFLRSPAVDGRGVHARVTPVKLGKRLSIFDAELRDDEGTLLARATADARFDV
ncbi:hypothetical protein nbrc107696_02520 [Gordonia spumicola]|uniref:Acyl-CoA thioesterase-like N-terminal HotDog domain-containing protein n=1 Tax=Gordonia spumicola TaxID=589161 RepID=A0A7I9V323_9ACTN|nr:PaaI family thioesterase [Gordonia spumicola]GED99805.1 hypothetical protein nbrc107696_02520 [Gordonia spumicola]